MNALTVTFATGDTAKWTRNGDGLTRFDVHPSGALQVWCGVDVPPRVTYSFGTWVTVETD